ncbi:MAG: hypothetical protein K6E91_11255 [Butyrivibrio sp.]|nr:hypothetical protein [Butyrivibrio sp.]
MSRHNSGSHIGSASIMLIFTVLTMVSFAALSLSSSKADYNLSQKLLDRQQAYTRASHEGNAFVAAVNSGYNSGAEGDIIRKSIPISDNQSLNIAIMTKNSSNSDNSENLPVIKWKIEHTREFDYDTTLPVMK